MGNKVEPAKKTKTAKATKKPDAKNSNKIVKAKVAKPVAVRQKAASKSVEKTVVKMKIAISRDDIALRAYYLSEKRRQHGINGDSAHDWLEAERQLIAELKSKKSA